jgi:hypothetical protein
MRFLLNIRAQIAVVLLLFVTLLAGSCSDGPTNNGADSPTEGYKRLYEAVKKKDTEAIKSQVSKKTQEFALMSSQRFNKSIEATYENGFTATTYAESLPSIRDERIKDNMGAVEVWNSRNSRWEDLPYILEEGAWKLAIGDAFAGSYQSPGKGRDTIERDAANAVSNRAVVVPANNTAVNKTPSNSNAPSPK